MNRGQISNTLRKIGLLYPLDKLRYRLEQNKNNKANQKFKTDNPGVCLPPDYLMYESFRINYSKYYFGGKATAEEVIEQIEKHINLKGKRVLDWGCGPGRVIRHMPKVLDNQADFYATDYNKESIQWCQKNIKNIQFNHNNLEANLPYENDYFDVIYGLSIFTHLSKDLHFSWFNELKRILKPGGIILITTQGENFKPKLSYNEQKIFDEGELIVRGDVKEGHRTFSAFHPDQFLKTLFNETQILDKIVISPKNKSYIPQDTWILGKKNEG